MRLFHLILLVSLLAAAPALARKGADDYLEGGHKSSGHSSPYDQNDDYGQNRARNFSSDDNHDGPSHGEIDNSGAVDIYAPAMDTMQTGMMDLEPSGNADVDFARSIIPHHQGAIDMAKILKEKGKDPELKLLADQIISSQEKEIAMMKDWLKRHGAE